MILVLLLGPPNVLQSDNGGEFTAEVITHLSKAFSFEIKHGKAYNPREQGKVEHANGTVATLLAKHLYGKKSE